MMVTEAKESVLLPITARSAEFHKQAFPGIFGMGKQVLVIGAGLSDIVLEEGVTCLDPGYSDALEMFEAFRQIDFDGGDEAVAFLMARLISSGLLADRILPVSASELEYSKRFDHVVSANCIFGGLEEHHNQEELIAMVERALDCVENRGNIQLFPFLREDAFSLWVDHLSAPALKYEAMRQKQVGVLRHFQKIGCSVGLKTTFVENGLAWNKKHTAVIQKS